MLFYFQLLLTVCFKAFMPGQWNDCTACMRHQFIQMEICSNFNEVVERLTQILSLFVAGSLSVSWPVFNFTFANYHIVGKQNGLQWCVKIQYVCPTGLADQYRMAWGIFEKIQATCSMEEFHFETHSDTNLLLFFAVPNSPPSLLFISGTTPPSSLVSYAGHNIKSVSCTYMPLTALQRIHFIHMRNQTEKKNNIFSPLLAAPMW